MKLVYKEDEFTDDVSEEEESEDENNELIIIDGDEPGVDDEINPETDDIEEIDENDLSDTQEEEDGRHDNEKDKDVSVSGRKRKPTKIFVPETIKATKEDIIQVGRGLPLGNFPKIEQQIQKHKSEDLKNLHKFLFKRPGTKTNIKRNIRKFSGFPFEKYTEEYEKKKATKLTISILKQFCEILDLPRTGTLEVLKTRVLEFLLEPTEIKPPKITSKTIPKKSIQSSSEPLPNISPTDPLVQTKQTIVPSGKTSKIRSTLVNKKNKTKQNEAAIYQKEGEQKSIEEYNPLDKYLQNSSSNKGDIRAKKTCVNPIIHYVKVPSQVVQKADESSGTTSAESKPCSNLETTQLKNENTKGENGIAIDQSGKTSAKTDENIQISTNFLAKVRSKLKPGKIVIPSNQPKHNQELAEITDLLMSTADFSQVDFDDIVSALEFLRSNYDKTFLKKFARHYLELNYPKIL